MVQIYENNLWGGKKIEFYSGLGSHPPEKAGFTVTTLYMNNRRERQGKSAEDAK